MKTLYLTNSSANIAVDTENNTVGTMDSVDRYDIRQAYYIEEPTHVVYNAFFEGKEYKEEIDAKKGDIVLVFYLNRFTKKVLATIRCKEWVANMKNRAAIEQKEKEEWAAKKAEAFSCGDCKCCDCEAPTCNPF